jgi:hypothetical protein
VLLVMLGPDERVLLCTLVPPPLSALVLPRPPLPPVMVPVLVAVDMLPAEVEARGWTGRPPGCCCEEAA